MSGIEHNCIKKRGGAGNTTYDLQLDGLAFQLDGSDFEIDTNGRNVAFGVGVISETQQQARFTNARIADKEELEQVVAAREIDD